MILVRPGIVGAGLLAICFSLSPYLESGQDRWNPKHAKAGSVLETLLGDGRRLFANHFFVKADVYFHGGYYPGVFDQQPGEASQEAHEGKATPEHHENAEEAHEKGMDFLGQPKDIIDRFGRHFFASQHSHLEESKTKELLPWIRLSAELDPNRPETYVVGSYWLADQIGKVEEAIDFLREGWRQNPDSYLILLEYGRVVFKFHKDFTRARNLWTLALKKWEQSEGAKPQPDFYPYEQLLAHLADLEEKEGNTRLCVEYLRKLKVLSPQPEVIQKQIDERLSRIAP